MKLSLCMTNYNRTDMLLESFAAVRGDPRISEIVVVDDASTDPTVAPFLSYLPRDPKLRIFRNEVNIGVGPNKHRAVEYATNPHCIIFDSDNMMGKDYLDALEPVVELLDKGFILIPAKALPAFDFTGYQNEVIDLKFARRRIGEHMFQMLTNIGNYAIPRDLWLKICKPNPAIKSGDVTYATALGLLAGRSMAVVRGMVYQHRCHAGSNAFRNPASCNLGYEMIIGTAV